jgi:lysophospholipase L1-like esterase
MFTNLRAVAPNAKLVFVEGFAPPTGFSGFNADYIAIRAAAQAALAAIGVTYINVATLLPWIKGTGYNSTGDATENSYAYISSDGVHPNDAGHLYIRQRMGQRLRRVLYDDGSLLNALV